MFRKLTLALLICLFLVSHVSAAPVTIAEIMDTDFNAVTTSDTSDVKLVSGYDKVAFFVVYDETEVGGGVSAAITLDVSYDGTNWLTGMSFMDVAGTTTPQTSETLSSDGWYLLWLNKDVCVPYVRVAVAASNTDANDLLTVKVYLVAKE